MKETMPSKVNLHIYAGIVSSETILKLPINQALPKFSISYDMFFHRYQGHGSNPTPSSHRASFVILVLVH